MKYLIAVFCLSIVLVACKKDPITPPTPTTTDSFALMQDKILTKSCALSGCHASTADNSYQQHKLVLKGTDVYTALFNGSVKNADAITAGLKQVVPNNIDKSFFYQKLIFATSIHQYGNEMPLGADPLTAKQVQFVREWINAGAPKTGDVADKTLLD
jgi:hypothetical protein